MFPPLIRMAKNKFLSVRIIRSKKIITEKPVQII